MPSRRSPRSLLLPLALAAAFTAAEARAVTITYAAIDLPDVAPGEDLWSYAYHLDRFPYAAGYGFTVFFDVGSTASLQIPKPPTQDWDQLAVQPDPSLPDDGFFDALLLQPSPTLDFLVQFVWTGRGTPGPQRYVVYDDKFATLEAGSTVLPEPGVALLLGAGALGLLRRGARS